MEKFPFSRDEFAKELKNTRNETGGKELASDLLHAVQGTDEYQAEKQKHQEEQHEHLQKKLHEKIAGIREEVIETDSHKNRRAQGILDSMKNDSLGKMFNLLKNAQTIEELTGSLEGYQVAADNLLSVGIWNEEMKQLLEHLNVEVDSDKYKEYNLKCAQRALPIYMEGASFDKHGIYRRASQEFDAPFGIMKFDEIIEVYKQAGIKMSSEEEKFGQQYLLWKKKFE